MKIKSKLMTSMGESKTQTQGKTLKPKCAKDFLLARLEYVKKFQFCTTLTHIIRF